MSFSFLVSMTTYLIKRWGIKIFQNSFFSLLNSLFYFVFVLLLNQRKFSDHLSNVLFFNRGSCKFILVCLYVRPSETSVVWNLHIRFFKFWHNTSQNKKNLFCAKMGKVSPKCFLFCIFFKKNVLFPVNNLKWKILMLVIVIFHCKPLIWQNSASQVMGRNTMDRSDYMFFKS